MPQFPINEAGDSMVYYNTALSGGEEWELTAHPAAFAVGTAGKDKPLTARFYLNTQDLSLKLKIIVPELAGRITSQIPFQYWEPGFTMTDGDELASKDADLNRAFLEDVPTTHMIQNGAAIEIHFTLNHHANLRVVDISEDGKDLVKKVRQFVLDCSARYCDRYKYDGINPSGYAEAIHRVRESQDEMYHKYSEELLFLSGMDDFKRWSIYMSWLLWLQSSGLGKDVIDLISDLARVTTCHGSNWWYKLQLRRLDNDICTKGLTMDQFRKLRKPWWLEQRWDSSTDAEYDPIQWASFTPPLNPVVDSAYWMSRLALSRENLEQSRVIAKISKQFSGQMAVRFIQDYVSDSTICAVSFGQRATDEMARFDIRGDTLRPRGNARFRLILHTLLIEDDLEEDIVDGEDALDGVEASDDEANEETHKDDQATTHVGDSNAAAQHNPTPTTDTNTFANQANIIMLDIVGVP
jgi:hypothetical protein